MWRLDAKLILWSFFQSGAQLWLVTESRHIHFPSLQWINVWEHHTRFLNKFICRQQTQNPRHTQKKTGQSIWLEEKLSFHRFSKFINVSHSTNNWLVSYEHEINTQINKSFLTSKWIMNCYTLFVRWVFFSRSRSGSDSKCKSYALCHKWERYFLKMNLNCSIDVEQRLNAPRECSVSVGMLLI